MRAVGWTKSARTPLGNIGSADEFQYLRLSTSKSDCTEMFIPRPGIHKDPAWPRSQAPLTFPLLALPYWKQWKAGRGLGTRLDPAGFLIPWPCSPALVQKSWGKKTTWLIELCSGCGFKVSNRYLCCHGNANFIRQFIQSK